MDRSTKADDEVPPEGLEHPIQLLVAEAAIRKNGDLDVLLKTLVKPFDHSILVIVALSFQRGFADRHPDKRSRATMARDEIASKGRMIVGIELGPVERDNDLLPRTDHEFRPRMKQQPDVDPAIAQHAIDLLDPMLLAVVRCVGVPATDCMHREHRRIHGPHDTVRQRKNTHRVKVIAEDLLDGSYNLQRILLELPRRGLAHKARSRHLASDSFRCREIIRSGSDHLRLRNEGIHQLDGWNRTSDNVVVTHVLCS